MPSLNRSIKMDEVLRQLSREIDADYFEGNGPLLLGRPRVTGSTHSYGMIHAQAGPWNIAIGGYTSFPKGNYVSYTQIYASYVNPGGFRFSIAHANFFRNLGKKLGLLRDIVVGFPDFDEAFVIDGNDESRLRALFADPEFRGRIQAQPKFVMKVWDKPWLHILGTEPYFPENVDVLLFQVDEAIMDVERLKRLIDLFVATLEQLCLLDSARREPSGVAPWGLFGIAIPKLSPPQVGSMADGPGLNELGRPPEWPDRERQPAISSPELKPGAHPVGSLIRAGCLSLSLAVILLTCVISLIVLAIMLPIWRVNTHYLASSCVVLDKRLAQTTSKGNQLSYKPEIKIRYEAQGRSYDVWTYEAINIFNPDHAGQQVIVDRFQVGSTVPCWYDPDRPDSAVLVRRSHSGFTVALICLTVVLLLGVAGLVISWKMKVPMNR